MRVVRWADQRDGGQAKKSKPLSSKKDFDSSIVSEKFQGVGSAPSEQSTERAGQSTNRSGIVILVVILSAGIAVGLLVFILQFLKLPLMGPDPLNPFEFFVLCLLFGLLIAWGIWRQLGSGLNQLWRVILGFLFASAVGVIMTVVIFLYCFLILGTAFGYGYWIEAWEGCVVEKYTYIDYYTLDDTMTYYAVNLTTGHKKHLLHSEWNRVKVGDYIVKKSRSYTIEIRPKP